MIKLQDLNLFFKKGLNLVKTEIIVTYSLAVQAYQVNNAGDKSRLNEINLPSELGKPL